ncbi:MAG: extracellular solute-binding protein [Patescibacteria group bacterium]
MINKLKIFSIFLILSIILAGCSLMPSSGSNSQNIEPITLQFWGVFDSSDAYKDIITAYQTARPNIKVEYKKLTWGEYQNSLLEAWAEDRGPDIFLIENDWAEKYKSKISPLPAKLKVPVITTSGSFSKKTTVEIKEITSLTPEALKRNFVDAVYNDAVVESQILGLPLSVDTLALFYNRAMLDASGVVEVPTTWQELIEAVPKITRQDTEGNIVRSAVALGGSENILNSDSILSLLMMQNGTQMVSNNGQISFDDPASYDSSIYPGDRALQFYADFGLPMKAVYTWNKDFPEAQDAFLQGKLAMMFGFAYQIPYLRAQGPALDFGIAPMLHINKDGTDAVLGQGVNVANYWMLTASKKTKHINEAWDFILFATTSGFKNDSGATEFQAEKYLKSTNKPPALRTLINKYSEDPLLEPFVSQVLTAKNWYHGKNPEHMALIFNQMINNLLSGSKSAREAIRFGAGAVQSTY